MHWSTPKTYWSAMSAPKEEDSCCRDRDCTCGLTCDCCDLGRASDLGVVLGGILVGMAAMSLVWMLVELS